MRFSPQFWNPWSLTWADCKAQEDNLHPEIQLLNNNLQPQKPPVTINNSDFRLAPVFYILLERLAAWKCWEMDNPPWWLTGWLIDWLIIQSSHISATLLYTALITLLVSGATCTPQRFPFSISFQKPQTDPTNSLFLLLVAPASFLFCFHLTLLPEHRGESSNVEKIPLTSNTTKSCPVLPTHTPQYPK